MEAADVIPVIDTTTMTYDPDTRTLVTSCSSHPPLRRAFPMALDVRSHRTGRVLRFVDPKPVMAGDGADRELVMVIYHNAAENLQLNVLNN